ncbi:MAG: DUF3971 domain-containing protein, partial [Gammaproteobacteria bacterium]|nr:DUF3971 domain-containing protein [Gammaproteobacteria bacterium]
MGSLKRRLWKITAGTLAGIVILLAIGVGLFNAAVPFVPALSSTAEERVEEAIGWPLRIGSMDLRWQFIGPMLVLEDVALLSPNTGTPVIRVARIDLVFRPGDLLQESDYRPAHVRLHEPQLAIERDASGEIWLSGHRIDVDPEARLDWRTLLRRSLKHGRFSIIDGTLVYRDEILDIDNWSLRNFNLTLASDGREHEFTGSFLPPGPLGEQAAFSVETVGDASRPEDWIWTAEIGARQVRINWLYEQLEWAGAGRFDGTMNLSAEMRGTGLHEWRGQGDFSAAEFGFVPRGPRVSAGGEDTVEAVSFDWILERDSDYLAIDLENLEVRQGGDPWPDSHLRIAMRSQASDAAQLDLRASYLRLEDLSPILRWLPTQWVSNEIDKAITGLEPHGELRDVHLQLSQPEGLRSLALSGRNVGVEPWQDVPGISGIDLDISGSASAGHATFRTEGASLDLRPLFRERIPVDELSGELGWQSSDSGTALALARLVVGNEDASVQGSGSIYMPNEGAVQVALQGNVKNARVGATPRYLPVKVMNDRLVEWLDRATPAGRIPEASWKLEGPLEQFPWKDGGGVFDIRFPINGLTLVYDKDWPRIENADVDVHFSQASLSVRARRGKTLGIDINGVEAFFEELGRTPLLVDGSVKGDSRHAFEFLAASPLQENLSAVLDQLAPDGPFTAAIDLDLPLDDLDASSVEVMAQLQDVNIDIGGLPWPVRSLAGDMRFTRTSISGSNLSGDFTGNPLRATMSSETAVDGIGPIRIDLEGRTDTAELGAYLPPGWGGNIEGAFNWQGQLHANREGEPFRVELQSTLAEVSSTLPAPLHELPAAAASITFPHGEGIHAAITLNELLKARLGFARKDDASPLRLRRGVIEAGSEA